MRRLTLPSKMRCAIMKRWNSPLLSFRQLTFKLYVITSHPSTFCPLSSLTRISCILENIRQEIYAKIGVRVTLYRQLLIRLLFSRSLKICVNFAFVLTPKLAGEPDVYSLLIEFLCSSPRKYLVSSGLSPLLLLCWRIAHCLKPKSKKYL